MRIHWKEILIGLAAGIFVGWFAAFGAVHCGLQGWRPEKKLEILSRELRLDAGQKQKIQRILEDTREKIEALRAENKPRLESVRTQAREEIAALLTPAQKEKFEKLHSKWEGRREKRKFRHPPADAPPGPPPAD